jgi:sec-independent protein translocase protein TatA
MTPLAFLNLGFGEMVVVGVVALLVFGEKLPDAMRNLGRAYARFRQGLHDMSRPVREEIRRVTTLPPDSVPRPDPYPAAPVPAPGPPPLPPPPPPAPVSDEPPTP